MTIHIRIMVLRQTWEFAHPNNQKNTGPLGNVLRV